MKRIFVLGWYGNNNLGDEAFKPAFEALWPQFRFTFSNTLNDFKNDEHAAIWIGAGSVFDGKDGYQIPEGVPYAAIGVSLPNDKARRFLEKAEIVVVRDHASTAHFPRAFIASDIVLGRRWDVVRAPGRQVTFLLNDFFSVRLGVSAWSQNAWLRACHELAKVAQAYIDRGYRVVFYPMGAGDVDDRRAAAFVIGQLRTPGAAVWELELPAEERLVEELARSEFFITHRFHGMIYGAVTGTPYVVLGAASKMWNLALDCAWPGIVDYYGFTDSQINAAIQTVLTDSSRSKLNDQRERSYRRWQDISSIVADRFASSPIKDP